MGMKSYLARRLIQGVFLFIGALVLTFFIMRLAPGNYTDQFMDPRLDQATRLRLETQYGLNRPLHEQFILYLFNVLQLDFGFSFHYKLPVLVVLSDKMMNTLWLSTGSMIFSIAISIPLGIAAGTKPYSKIDNANTVFTLIGFSIPIYWFALMTMIIFSTTVIFPVRLLPLQGMASLPPPPQFTLEWVWDRLTHMALPIFALGFGSLALLSRLTRSSMIDVLSQDYIRTARAKGLRERDVVYKHGFRNARLPVVTVIGLNLGFIFSGAVLTETIFSWPGMGRLMIQAIFERDYPLLMGDFIITAVLVILANIITDISYAYLDPRITYD
jgi:peptide/nickel transport system permease protein